MATYRESNEIKYEDKTLRIDNFIKNVELPTVVKVKDIENDYNFSNNLKGKSMLIQQVRQERFAHIRVLEFYDNEEKQTEKGAEYVLEHETFVGNEYLLPLNFLGRVKYVRRPGSRCKYLTIRDVINDSPAFVRVDNDVTAVVLNGTNQRVTVPRNTILELIRIYKKETDGATCFLECNDGVTSFEFCEDDKVNWIVFERNKFYSLDEISAATLLPKVVLFDAIDPEKAVLKCSTLRSALLTIVEGPIEVLGFVDVKYLVCWLRNTKLKTYETLLILENSWNKMYLQKRYFCDDFERQVYIKKRYGHCLTLFSISSSLYIIPLHMDEDIWLRCPDLFKRNLGDLNRMYDVVEVPFEESSSDGDEKEEDTFEHVYDEIQDPLLEPTKTSKYSKLWPLVRMKFRKRNIWNLMKHLCKERFVHIKVLPFHDNAEKQVEVLEHEAHAGEEYLFPLTCSSSCESQ